MSEIKSRRSARGRVSLRRRRARASEGRLFVSFVCFETGRRRDTRLWLRGFAGLPVRVPCFEKPCDGADVPLRAPCECVVQASRSNRCTSRGAQRAPRDVAAEARRLHDQSARKPAGAPDGRVKRLAAAAPTSRSAGPSGERSCRNSIRTGLRRGVDAPASRCVSWPVRSAPSVAEGGYDAGL